MWRRRIFDSKDRSVRCQIAADALRRHSEDNPSHAAHLFEKCALPADNR